MFQLFSPHQFFCFPPLFSVSHSSFSCALFYSHLCFSPFLISFSPCSPCPSPAGSSITSVQQLEHCTVWEGAALVLLTEVPACKLHALGFFSLFSSHKKHQWILLESQTKSDFPVLIVRHSPLTVSIHVKSVTFFHRSAVSVPWDVILHISYLFKIVWVL